MNNNNEIDHEYVLVEFHNNINRTTSSTTFQSQDEYNNENVKDVLTMDIDDYNDNDINDIDIDEEWLDDESYVQYFEEDELSLTPSVTASVCSETMFGELSSLNSKKTTTKTVTKDGPTGTESVSSDEVVVNGGGKPRSCSIVSLHDEEDLPRSKNEMNMDMEVDDDLQEEKKTISQEGPSTTTTTFKATLKKGIKNERGSNSTTSSSGTMTNSGSGSRLSNKKRRKKMKQLKKAAAVAAFATMKEQNSISSVGVATSNPSLVPKSTVKPTKVAVTKVNTTSSTSSSGNSNANGHKKMNIAVICAREAIICYEEEMKRELSLKKKANGGTLNYEF